MFYSQFILAKKGPLGTIWIAAHLERKLRKNQVADTDIGVSVDSILCPDVPIALRLSSHLLLGVVRIYSRKVNYLFHDCSEALLKIKQAFRSTVVDLPPEESTAPYHSITLPETFDLDDFELPDSAFLHGNFVDHHVSTREQITLQDSADGAGYSTSQFGLDERFGDGDASQIGLDLDEELFLAKRTSLDNACFPIDSEANLGNDISAEAATPLVNMDIDDYQGDDESGAARSQKNLPEGSSSLQAYNIHTPDLNEVVFSSRDIGSPYVVPNEIDVSCPSMDDPLTDILNHAQAPQTPKLMEEQAPKYVQETPALGLQEKMPPSNIIEDIMQSSIQQEPDYCNLVDESGIISSFLPSSNDLSGVVEAIPDNGQKTPVNIQKTVNEVHNGTRESTQDVINTMTSSTNANKTCETELLPNTLPGDASNIPMSSIGAFFLGCKSPEEKAEAQSSAHHEPSSCLDTNLFSLDSECILRKCTSQLKQGCDTFLEDRSLDDNPPTEEMFATDKAPQAHGSSFEAQERDPEMHQESDHTSLENKEDVRKPDGLPTDIISNNPQLDGLHCSASSDYPEPEKMLRAPNEDHNVPNDIDQCTAEKGVTESDGSVDRLQSLSGKKRRLAEGSPALLAGEAPRSKRNAKFIPEDDDLLASILVGRKTNASKLKSTPPLQIIPSSKRPRLTSKVGGLKRKVLLDDTMVLHADAIRQQLMNTEGIRRIRKKAPCTDPEIWMIQKCLLEEDIFGESVLTGMSTELAILHYKIYDPEERLFAVNNATYSHSGIPKLDAPRSSELVGEISVGVGSPAGYDTSDKNASMIPENTDIHALSGIEKCQHGSSALENGAKEDMKFTIDKLKQNLSSSDQACSVVSDEMQIGDCRNEGLTESNVVIRHDAFAGNETALIDANDKMESTAPVGDVLYIHAEQGSLEDSAQLPQKYQNAEPVDNLDITKNAPVLSETASEIVENGTPATCHQDCQIIECENAIEGMQQMDLKVTVEGQALSPSCVPEPSSVIEITPSNVGENSCLQESNIECARNTENINGIIAMRDSCDFGSGIGGNDTEFLNVDDEVDFGEDYDEPNPEEAQSLENSGWSARTRGVARYLKSLFEDESGRGRKFVPMDRLLVGKTRKEASRMFFETLVLKTRDYIHVEQENAFQNIDVKPRAKLLKSDF